MGWIGAIPYVGPIIAVCVAIIGYFLNNKRVIKQAKEKEELTIRREAAKVEQKVDGLSDEEVRERLKKWERKP